MKHSELIAAAKEVAYVPFSLPAQIGTHLIILG